jgi:hypothetical protein
MLHLVENLFDNQASLFIIGLLLTAPPVLGIWEVHEYGWQHWEPFDKRHKK